MHAQILIKMQTWITKTSIWEHVWTLIFEQVRTRFVFVLPTILGFQDRISTRPRTQTFKIRLEKESWVGTPLCQNLLFTQSHYFSCIRTKKAKSLQFTHIPMTFPCVLNDLIQYESLNLTVTLYKLKFNKQYYYCREW